MDEKDFTRKGLKGGAYVNWDREGRPYVYAYTASGYGEYVHYAPVSRTEMGLPSGGAFLFHRRGVVYKLTWDRPERFPFYVKELTHKALKWMWANVYERIDHPIKE